MNAIFRRRSIRDFKDKIVPEKLIRKLLLAGMAAPSSWGSKPWHFVVIKDRKTLDEIAKRHEYAKMAARAPLAILVCCEPDKMKEAEFFPQDCSAATENILIEATHLGLGSVWVGLYPKSNLMNILKELTELPGNIIPFSLVIIGFPKEKKPPYKEFLKERVHYEKW